MIAKIEIRPKYKGIQKLIALNNLEQVNVICGKNSSGKSSILESISNARTLKNVLLKLDKEFDLEKYAKKKLATCDSFKNVSGVHSIISKYYGTNNSIFLDYPNESRLKVEYEHLKPKKQGQIKYSMENLGKFINSLEDMLKLDYFKNSLIPTNRKIEDSIPIAGEKYSANGDGIVRKVYINKNQLNNSKEYNQYQRIAKNFYDICDFSFDITRNNKDELVLNFSRDQENWYTSSDSGFGLSDIFIIVSFTILSDSNLIMIEEPENHIHSDFQRRLLKFLNETTEKQFLLSSHSSVFLDSSLIDSIFYTDYIDNTISIINTTSKATILKNLGYSIYDNLLSDILILVEGPSDIPVLSTIFNWMGFYNNFNIKFWPLGGDTMNKLDLSVFIERNNVIAIIDSDFGSRHVRNKFMENCMKNNIPCYQLERYALENYFTLDAISKVFHSQITDGIEDIAPEIKVEDQIGLDPKKKNWNIINAMTLDDIEGTDLFDYCTKIKMACERGSTQFLLGS